MMTSTWIQTSPRQTKMSHSDVRVRLWCTISFQNVGTSNTASHNSTTLHILHWNHKPRYSRGWATDLTDNTTDLTDNTIFKTYRCFSDVTEKPNLMTGSQEIPSPPVGSYLGWVGKRVPHTGALLDAFRRASIQQVQRCQRSKRKWRGKNHELVLGDEKAALKELVSRLSRSLLFPSTIFDIESTVSFLGVMHVTASLYHESSHSISGIMRTYSRRTIQIWWYYTYYKLLKRSNLRGIHIMIFWTTFRTWRERWFEGLMEQWAVPKRYLKHDQYRTIFCKLLPKGNARHMWIQGPCPSKCGSTYSGINPGHSG